MPKVAAAEQEAQLGKQKAADQPADRAGNQPNENNFQHEGSPLPLPGLDASGANRGAISSLTAVPASGLEHGHIAVRIGSKDSSKAGGAKAATPWAAHRQ